MFLLGVEGKDPQQRDIWKPPTNLGVQGSHNPCFYPEIVQTDIEPGDLEDMRNFCVLQGPFFFKGERTYFSSIMGNSEICSREFWFDEPLVCLKSLIQLICKCFVG